MEIQIYIWDTTSLEQLYQLQLKGNKRYNKETNENEHTDLSNYQNETERLLKIKTIIFKIIEKESNNHFLIFLQNVTTQLLQLLKELASDNIFIESSSEDKNYDYQNGGILVIITNLNISKTDMSIESIDLVLQQTNIKINHRRFPLVENNDGLKFLNENLNNLKSSLEDTLLVAYLNLFKFSGKKNYQIEDLDKEIYSENKLTTFSLGKHYGYYLKNDIQEISPLNELINHFVLLNNQNMNFNNFKLFNIKDQFNFDFPLIAPILKATINLKNQRPQAQRVLGSQFVAQPETIITESVPQEVVSPGQVPPGLGPPGLGPPVQATNSPPPVYPTPLDYPPPQDYLPPPDYLPDRVFKQPPGYPPHQGYPNYPPDMVFQQPQGYLQPQGFTPLYDYQRDMDYLPGQPGGSQSRNGVNQGGSIILDQNKIIKNLKRYKRDYLIKTKKKKNSKINKITHKMNKIKFRNLSID